MTGDDLVLELYSERSACVAALVKAATAKQWVCWWCIDPETGPRWPVVGIELPTGQVTWHVSQADFDKLGLAERLAKVDHATWDGHSTEEKYRRLAACEWSERPDWSTM
jgi:hypothetical protein